LAKLVYSDRTLNDLERLAGFLLTSDTQAVLEPLELIEEAVAVLKRHPLMGRPVESDMRELVISRGRTGYVALYSLDAMHDAVLILAIRHQREAGYWSPDE
jgi:plasmid stabilization system protein ParE